MEGAISFALVLVGPTLAERVAEWAHLGPAFALPWKVAQWPVVFGLVTSLMFKFYIATFTSYNAIYGAIGGVIVLMLWFYVSALAVVVGAELNAEIEHASPYGKDPGEKKPGEKRRLGVAADRAWIEAQAAGTFKPAIAGANCDVDDLLLARPSGPPHPRLGDWIRSGLVIAQTALIAYLKLKSRIHKVRS